MVFHVMMWDDFRKVKQQRIVSWTAREKIFEESSLTQLRSKSTFWMRPTGIYKEMLAAQTPAPHCSHGRFSTHCIILLFQRRRGGSIGSDEQERDWPDTPLIWTVWQNSDKMTWASDAVIIKPKELDTIDVELNWKTLRISALFLVVSELSLEFISDIYYLQHWEHFMLCWYET